MSAMQKRYPGVTKLVHAAADNPELQARIALSESPEQLIAIAAEAGAQIPPEELRDASRDLCAPYWPWASKGTSFRRLFFSGCR